MSLATDLANTKKKSSYLPIFQSFQLNISSIRLDLGSHWLDPDEGLELQKYSFWCKVRCPRPTDAKSIVN